MRPLIRGQSDEQEEDGPVGAVHASAPRMPSWLARRMRMLDRLNGRLPSHVGFQLAAVLFLATGVAGAVSAGRCEEFINALSASGGLQIDSVKITGQMETSEVAVLQKLELPPDAALPSIDVEAARERIETLPWVQKASLRKIYPSTLKITIDERQPYVLWQHDQSLSVLDESGRVIGEAGEVHRDLIRVAGDGVQTRAAEALALADTVPSVRAHLRAAVLVGGRRWNLVLDDGVTLMLPQDDPKAALAKIAELDAKNNLLGRDIVSVDMRLGDRIFVRLSPDAAAKRDVDLKEQAKIAKRKGAST